jgi:hypothetical protein
MSQAQVYNRAGFPFRHGQAFQQIADESDRIIVSRCAQQIGVQLLEESYASKGYGIKAKSCDWGPFAGFAMAHFQYSKFATGQTPYEKQIGFFKESGHTGFQNEHVHLEMARPDVLRVTTRRLEFLIRQHKISVAPGIGHGAVVSCRGPFGPIAFQLALLQGSEACWAFLHYSAPPPPLQPLARASAARGAKGVDAPSTWQHLTFVKGMVNLLPEDRNLTDPAKNCVAGDYDLWGVFPRKGSSMAKHGMDRQVPIFAGVNPNASKGIRDRVAALQADARNRAPERTQVKTVGGQREEFKYKEDPELGNISPLVMDTMHKLNRRIQKGGYRGGRMVHHNDDLGNPFRNDVERDLIAFIPHDRAYFITNASYYSFIRPFEATYAVYDNQAIWGRRA